MSPLTYYLMHCDSFLQCDISMNLYLQHVGIYQDLCLHFLCYYLILPYVPKTFFTFNLFSTVPCIQYLSDWIESQLS